MKKLLNISDLKQSDLFSIFKYAESLNNQNEQILNNKNIGLIFEKFNENKTIFSGGH